MTNGCDWATPRRITESVLTMGFHGVGLIVTVAALLLMSAPNSYAQDASPAVQRTVEAAQAERALLLTIYQSPTKEQLSAILAKTPPRSRIGVMLVAAKQYEFQNVAAEPAVLAALPKSYAEMQAFDQFSTGEFNGADRYFYAAGFSAAAHHPAALPAIFSLATEFKPAVVAEDPSMEWYCGELEILHTKAPQPYDQAVMRAPIANRDYLKSCGAGK